MRKLTAINFLDTFIASALAVLVPLLLLARDVQVSEIGLVLSALPLVFLFARLLFSAIADQAGFRSFFIVDWLAQAFSVLIYLFAATPIGFIFGKVAEGVRASAFWAVNRTAIFYYAEGRETRAAMKLYAIRTAGAAIATALVGVLAAFFGLQYALIFLLGIVLLQGFPTFTMKPYPKARFSMRKTLSLLLPFGKSRRFWLTAATLALYPLATYSIFYLIAPVYMRLNLGMGYDTIGYVVAAYYLLSAVSASLAMRYRIPFGRLAMLQALLFAAGCVLIALTNASLFIPLFLLLSLGDGLSGMQFEAVIAKETKGKPTVSTDIGFLHIPYRAAEFVSVIFAGFVFQYLGYSVVFVLSGACFAAYSFLCWRLLSR